jgi:hypothetical protein
VPAEEQHKTAVVVEKTYDFLLWLFPKVEKFPRSFRFTPARFSFSRPGQGDSCSGALAELGGKGFQARHRSPHPGTRSAARLPS